MPWDSLETEVQGDTKTTVITKNRITSKVLFRLTQNFSYIRSSLCIADISKISSLYYKNSFFPWRSKNVVQMTSPALEACLDPAGKVLDDPPAFLPWDRSYCCLQVRDSLGVVATHPVLKVSPQIKIWGVQVRWMRRPLLVKPAADQSVRETLL